MFSYQIPHTFIRSPNPVFEVELRRVRRLRSAASLTRYSRAVLLVPFLALIAWWLLNVWAFAQASGYEKFAAYFAFTTACNILGIVIFLFALVMMLALDFYAVVVSINTIGHDISLGQLDLLRLTDIQAKDYVAAKYATAQIRAWRVLALEVAARLLGIVLIIAASTYMSSWSYGGCCVYSRYVMVWPLVEEFANSLNTHPLRTLANAAVIGLLVAAYIAEPVWRMRAVTALGLAISARLRNLPVAALTAFGGLVFIHVVQTIFVDQLLRVTFISGSSVPGITKIALLIGLLVLFYRALNMAALSSARRTAFRVV